MVKNNRSKSTSFELPVLSQRAPCKYEMRHVPQGITCQGKATLLLVPPTDENMALAELGNADAKL